MIAESYCLTAPKRLAAQVVSVAGAARSAGRMEPGERWRPCVSL